MINKRKPKVASDSNQYRDASYLTPSSSPNRAHGEVLPSGPVARRKFVSQTLANDNPGWDAATVRRETRSQLKHSRVSWKQKHPGQRYSKGNMRREL